MFKVITVITFIKLDIISGNYLQKEYWFCSYIYIYFEVTLICLLIDRYLV